MLLKMPNPVTYFISGVSGAGKTEAIWYLKTLLPPKKYAIHDFDERGVPDNVDHKWRQSESEYWLQVANKNAKRDLSTIISGLSQPNEVLNCKSVSQATPIKFCLLDLSDQKIGARLRIKHSTQEKINDLRRVSNTTLKEFIKHHIKYAKILRKLFKKYKGFIIDRTHYSDEETAQKVAEWIKNN